jgi:hypothetical protein
MNKPPKEFPDLSDLLARKAARRRANARRSFGEKIEMMEALRERLAPFKRAREERRAARKAQAGSATSPGSKT